LQWLEPRLAPSNPNVVELFEDEVRSFVAVEDVCRAISHLLSRGAIQVQADAPQLQPPLPRPPPPPPPDLSWASAFGAVFHMGGPEGLSRVELAQVIMFWSLSRWFYSSVDLAQCSIPVKWLF
jgi:hypothetical protein